MGSSCLGLDMSKLSLMGRTMQVSAWSGSITRSEGIRGKMKVMSVDDIDSECPSALCSSHITSSEGRLPCLSSVECRGSAPCCLLCGVERWHLALIPIHTQHTLFIYYMLESGSQSRYHVKAALKTWATILNSGS